MLSADEITLKEARRSARLVKRERFAKSMGTYLVFTGTFFLLLAVVGFGVTGWRAARTTAVACLEVDDATMTVVWEDAYGGKHGGELESVEPQLIPRPPATCWLVQDTPAVLTFINPWNTVAWFAFAFVAGIFATILTPLCCLLVVATCRKAEEEEEVTSWPSGGTAVGV